MLNGVPGQPSKLDDVQRQAIAGMIESGPIPAVHGVVRWRLIDLAQWIFEEFASRFLQDITGQLTPNFELNSKIQTSVGN